MYLHMHLLATVQSPIKDIQHRTLTRSKAAHKINDGEAPGQLKQIIWAELLLQSIYGWKNGFG